MLKLLLLVLVVLVLLFCSARVARSQEVLKDLELTRIAAQQLIYLYQHETRVKGIEFAFCAFGVETDTSYQVLWVEMPPQRQGPITVNFDLDACEGRAHYLNIWGHSHPSLTPFLSDTDWRTFARQGGDWTILVFGDHLNVYARAIHRSEIPHRFYLDRVWGSLRRNQRTR